MHLCYLNSRSLVNKLSNFQSYVYSTPYNIYCITETWLSDSIFDCEILPCGYTLYRKDRASRGGGVLIAVHDSLSSTLVPSPPELEVITINLNFQNDPITLCTVYCSPNSCEDYQKRLLSYLYNITTSSEGIIIIGDFNVPDICWSSLSGSSAFSNSLCEFVYEESLSQLINCPTHIKGNTLDLILTNVENLISNLSVSEPHPLIPSDHFTLSFDFKFAFPPLTKKSCKYVFDYSKADYECLCDYLLDTDFSDCFHCCNVEDAWSHIKHAILNAMHLHIPKVKIKSFNHPKWYNSEIRHLIKCIRTLRRKCKSHSTSHNISKLQSLETQLQNKMLFAKSTYEKNLVTTFSRTNTSKIFIAWPKAALYDLPSVLIHVLLHLMLKRHPCLKSFFTPSLLTPHSVFHPWKSYSYPVLLFLTLVSLS